MKIEGNAVFEHCYFSGPVNKKTAGVDNVYIFQKPFNKNILLYALVILAIAGLLFYSFKRKFWHFS
jgi:hypothetical protein